MLKQKCWAHFYVIHFCLWFISAEWYIAVMHTVMCCVMYLQGLYDIMKKENKKLYELRSQLVDIMRDVKSICSDNPHVLLQDYKEWTSYDLIACMREVVRDLPHERKPLVLSHSGNVMEVHYKTKDHFYIGYVSPVAPSLNEEEFNQDNEFISVQDLNHGNGSKTSAVYLYHKHYLIGVSVHDWNAWDQTRETFDALKERRHVAVYESPSQFLSAL